MHNRKLSFTFILFLLIVLSSVSCSASSYLYKDKITPNDEVTLYGPVNAASATQVIQKIQDLQKFSKTKPIYMFIDSPGGEIFEGTKIIDAMMASKRPVYTVDVGMAASMAAYIEEYGVKRFMLPHTILMFHNASVSYPANMLPHVDSELSMLKAMVADLNNNVVDRSGVPITELAMKESQEWWLLSKEALDRHLVDRVIVIENYPVNDNK
jgi:ATP-dependent Clp protease protease subunit